MQYSISIGDDIADEDYADDDFVNDDMPRPVETLESMAYLSR